ncbi:MAG: methyl-accepting chemotaxis protein, partial [Thermodesulfobacteriota bacterium]
IAAASNEQAQGISQINQALGQIDQVTQQNTASAEQCAAAAEELSGQAIQMQNMLARFRVRDQGRMGGYGSVATRPRSLDHHPQSSDGGRRREAKPSDMIALDDKEFGKY